MIILMSDDTYVKYQMHQTEFDRYYRKQLEERVRMEERSENIQSILNQGNAKRDRRNVRYFESCI